MVKSEASKDNVRPGFEQDIRRYIAEYKSLLKAIGRL